jgi:Icc-related predicted phosphoesterase
MLPEEQLKWKFKYIPDNLDILITHTPPKGILDPTDYGSETLRKRLNDINPKIHIFGHNHGGYGYKENINTKFYNVSVCSDADLEHDYNYKLINPITLIKYES